MTRVILLFILLILPTTTTTATTPLHWAALKGDTDTMQRLINAGADVNATDKDGETPLHLAVSRDSYDAIKLLILASPDDAQGTATSTGIGFAGGCPDESIKQEFRAVLRDTQRQAVRHLKVINKILKKSLTRTESLTLKTAERSTIQAWKDTDAVLNGKKKVKWMNCKELLEQTLAISKDYDRAEIAFERLWKLPKVHGMPI